MAPTPRPAPPPAFRGTAADRPRGSHLPWAGTINGTLEQPYLGHRRVPIIDERTLAVPAFIDTLKTRGYRPLER